LSPRRRPLLIFSAIVALAAIVIWRMPEVAAWRWYLSSGNPAMVAGDISLAKPLRWFDDYYVLAELGDGAYAIGEPRYGQCNFSYLIVGSERALLFDTGPGIRDITKVVKALTSLPTVALPSHLHFDQLEISLVSRTSRFRTHRHFAHKRTTADLASAFTNSWDLSKGLNARPFRSPAGFRRAPISTSGGVPWS
jgi:hypothetical protein